MALALGFAALFLSGFIYGLFPIKPYFPFVAEVLLILGTWLLYRTDGQNLSALGLNPSFRNMAYLIRGLGIGVAALLVVTWLRTLCTGEVWHLASVVNWTALLKSLYFILPTAVVQELMFRGYLFTKTASRLGVVWANVIFATAFMLVHVVDRDVLQNPVQAVFLVVSIPVGHLWFSTALLRSRTILFPVGLHWGNNWAVQHLAGTADSPLSLFYLTGQTVFATWLPAILLLLIFNLFFLLLTAMIWKGRLPFHSKKPVIL